jgi:hypothetical protein
METTSFTDAEWLAILPNSGLPSTAPAKDSSSDKLPFRSVARFSRLLAMLQRLQVASMTVKSTTIGFALFAAGHVGTTVLLAVTSAVLGLPSQSTAAVGVFAYALYSVPMFLFSVEYILSYRIRPVRGPPQGAKQIYFWAALFPQTFEDEEVASVAAGRLIAHDPEDDLCSCILQSCSGRLPNQAAARYIVTGGFYYLQMAAASILALWTPLITFERSVWLTWLVLFVCH